MRIPKAKYFLLYRAMLPSPPHSLDDLSNAALKDLVFALFAELSELRQERTELRDEIRQLKKLPRRPNIKPSGLASQDKSSKQDSEPSGGSKTDGKQKKNRRGPRRSNLNLHKREVKVTLEDVPDGSTRKGYQAHTIRDIVIYAEEVTYLREVWQFPDGSRRVAPLPPGVVKGRQQYGNNLKALTITLYHQCQSTVARITALLNDMGLDISARQIKRFLNEDIQGIVDEQQDVLRAGMETAAWINVDDTGARHQAKNGFCTVIGNDLFTHFRSTGSKSRLDFLEHLCAGDLTYTVNDEALDYMRRMKLPEKTIVLFASHPHRIFRGEDAWQVHLATLGIDRITVKPDPIKIATEGALWGSICDAGRLSDTVILSDDAGQFNVGDAHALCWVHLERLIRKQQSTNEIQFARVQAVLTSVWNFYRELSAFRQDPCDAQREGLSARFDAIFEQRTGDANLDNLLRRLKVNKGELLRVLDYPSTPLHSNSAERDIRSQVTRRAVSQGTRSQSGRAARDAGLGALKTCQKLGVSFWQYARARLGVAGAVCVPSLADLIIQRSMARQFSPSCHNSNHDMRGLYE